jgi:hypothetical protein
MARKKKAKPVFPGKTLSQVEKFYKEKDTERKEPLLVEPPEGGWDSSYVPGFSDQRAMNEVLEHQGRKPVEMPANVAWARATGEQDYRGLIDWRRQGYEILKVDPETETCENLRKHGWDLPPAAQVMPDGTIRRDDVLLVYCPGDKHRENIERHEQKRDSRQGISSRDGIEMETEESRKIGVKDDEVNW